jgi:hypothetical protein
MIQVIHAAGACTIQILRSNSFPSSILPPRLSGAFRHLEISLNALEKLGEKTLELEDSGQSHALRSPMKHGNKSFSDLL